MKKADAWRDEARYAALGQIDRAGLMWEWLRRDRGYIAWYTRASTATRGAGALDWGLHFRRGSRAGRTRRPDHLARRTRSGHARRHRRPDRRR